MQRLIMVAGLLVLAACKPSAEPADEAADNGAAVSNAAAAVVALPQQQRDMVLFRAIRDAGLPCQGVVASERATGSGRDPEWQAECTDGGTHLVRVQADGTAVVVSRASR